MVEAIGFEEIIIRSREERKPKPKSQEAIVIEGAAGGGMSRELGALIDYTMVAFSPPEQAGFNQFYSEVNQTNIISANVENNILTLMSSTNNLSLNVRTVIELLAQQMKTPLSLPSELAIKSSPPFISNIKEITNYWISEMLCSYQKIFNLNDPMIQRLCHEYYLSLAYPILVRLAYTEWENKQMDWKVGLKVKEIAADYEKKNRDVRLEHAAQLEMKTTAMKTEMNKKQMENDGLKTSLSVMNERLNNAKQDLANNTGTVEEVQKKLKGEKAHTSLLEKEIITLKTEIKNLQGQIKEEEDEAGWKPDVTSTPELPVYRNKIMEKTLTFPVSMEQFKKEYKLKSQKDNICRYETDDGKSFELPDSLADELVDNGTKTIPGSNKMGSEAARLYKNNPKWDEIRKFIESVGGEASTSEIAIGINGSASNIRKQYLKEMEDKGLIAGEQVGKEKRYTLSM